MLSRRNADFSPLPSAPNPRKVSQCSLETEDSNSPRECTQSGFCKGPIRKDKQKSQLCKKYMQFGVCPYQKKCKFAHGAHELKSNHQHNSKYKTKQCGLFLSEGFCIFGERCNFIHPKPSLNQHQELKDSDLKEIKAGGRLQSRLLALLSFTH